jgi:hypothetical protein
MQTMQERVLDAVEQAIRDAGHDPVATREWANTGKVHAMDGLDAVFTLDYQFNSDHATLGLRGPAVVTAVAFQIIKDGPLVRVHDLGCGVTATAHYLKYADSARLKAFVALVAGL